MTEQRVKAEPTPFGEVVLEIADERNMFPVVPANMGLEPRHVQALEAHLDGVQPDNEYPQDFVQAVAYALGLDPHSPDDKQLCTELAYTHMFRKPFGS